MRLDWEIAKRGWRRYAAYPWATVAGVFTNTVFGFIQAYILLAVFHHRTDVGGYDASDAVTYVWLAQALIMTVYVFGWYGARAPDPRRLDRDRPLAPARPAAVLARLRSRPRAVPPDLPRDPPPFVDRRARSSSCTIPSPLDLVAFFVSVALAVVVSLGFRFLYNSAAFWLLDIRGVVTLSLTVSLFFSGMILPLTFFPTWLRAIAHALPFSSIVQTPIDVWLGKHHGAELVRDPGAPGHVGDRAARSRPGDACALGAKKLVIQGG